ncbi:MAG: hypothetical protein H7Y18_21265 [Clostridiaceae bacterium]|nr:hypothetical protein [Clostridiaceae bacterium]
MKTYKRIVIWILISVSIQVIGLFYLDKYYFAESSEIKSTKLVVPPKKIIKAVDIKVDSSAKQTQMSNDGKYLSYYDNDKLKVVDTVTGSVNTVKIPDGVSLSFYKWLPDRNRIILAEKMKKNQINIIKFYYYDVSKNITEEVRNDAKNQEIFFELKNEKSEIEDIELSPLTNVMYVKVLNPGRRNVIYRLNIMADINKLDLKVYSVGKMQISYTEDELYFEDLLYKKIRNSEGKEVKIPEMKSPSIVGSDSKNNIYIADVKDGLVNKIYWGIYKGNTTTWTSKELVVPVNVKNIYISLGGKIYVNDALNAVVTELLSGNQTKYTGVLQSIYTKGIATIEEGKLVKTSFK